MDDDMNSINLITSPELQSKMKFFFSPYGYSKSAAFYMKFNEGQVKEERLNSENQISYAKMWKKISDFVLKDDTTEFKKTIDTIRRNQIDKWVKNIWSKKDRNKPKSVQKRTKVNKASATARISINELGENKKMSKLTNDPAHCDDRTSSIDTKSPSNNGKEHDLTNMMNFTRNLKTMRARCSPKKSNHSKLSMIVDNSNNYSTSESNSLTGSLTESKSQSSLPHHKKSKKKSPHIKKSFNCKAPVISSFQKLKRVSFTRKNFKPNDSLHYSCKVSKPFNNKLTSIKKDSRAQTSKELTLLDTKKDSINSPLHSPRIYSTPRNMEKDKRRPAFFSKEHPACKNEEEEKRLHSIEEKQGSKLPQNMSLITSNLDFKTISNYYYRGSKYISGMTADHPSEIIERPASFSITHRQNLLGIKKSSKSLL
ncbi:unnamed protein product [Moneuplotes crassus]|uniref:Uncharacterized protein n=1 Tax=Euplotes crassus TaxID=5936 RepID=A0AAD1Y663_EUPCR|nr:unnamed protein product [Moneuplotes crassus]